MRNWITENYEQKIKLWYKDVLLGKEDTLYLDFTENQDFFPLQNFFLICQKERQRKLNLHIKTASVEDVFRIRHYLFACRELAETIMINGEYYRGMNIVTFFKILPLITINKENFIFLSSGICDIEKKLGNKIGRKMLEGLEQIKDDLLTVEQKCLLRMCLTCLYGPIKNFKDLELYRAKYFEKEEFRIKIENMPFLAFLIFSVYDRVNHEERAKKYKQEKKEQEKKKRVVMKIKDMPEALPTDDEILADIFNSWDLSDGILQLLENVVEHAGTQGNSKTGEGVLSIRIHTQSKEHDYLIKEFDQYFKGYENSYIEEYDDIVNGNLERTEKQYFSECHKMLKLQIDKGRFVEEKVLKDYEIIRKKIDNRRKSRMKNEYFIDIQIADISGKNMCDVFRENLKIRNYANKDAFKNIIVRSFFDPNRKEKETFKDYYQEQNIIHHYGLQIFASVVLNNDGYFRVRSHSLDNYCNVIYDTTKEDFSDLRSCMEGTRYRILLPFQRKPIQESNSMVNADIMYHTKQWEQKVVVDASKKEIQDFYKKIEEYRNTICTKEAIIYDLRQCLKKHENDILVFDMERIRTQDIEIFCKAIILYIATSLKTKSQNNIAIINCSTQDFVSIIRIFSVCYDKNGMSDWMQWAQVYLCGKDTREEFLLSGNNVHTLLLRVEKLAFSRKIHPMCIQILRKILERKRSRDGRVYLESGSEPEDVFNYTPFDLILKKEGRTIFENNVKMVLEHNIQSVECGYRIVPTHMRIGSRIHNNMFYEAELLFYNNYYTTRFAGLLFYDLKECLKEKNESLDSKSICLIGYDTYSEMLLCELKKIIVEKFSIPCEYVVYEIKTDGSINLRYKERINPSMQGVLVVPINSTLTTFNKVRAEVKNQVKYLPILAYLGVIQVMDSSKRETRDGRTGLEKVYWDKKDLINRRIYSKKLLGKDQYASYLVEVACLWENPLVCKHCFPEECLFEMPLIETNKTSVVPTQLIGLKEEFPDQRNKEIKRLPDVGKVESLKNYFYQGHIIRDDNHFCYYIRTAAYYQAYKKQIAKWLVEVRNAILKREGGNKVIFNIIVNPMHFSNTGFVEAVNEVVFKGASYVLRIESEKEFRDNTQTKYSDLTALYRNFVKTGNRAEFNFYFVDDNIITGKVFHRVKHLISSLFPEDNNIVQVNIFRSVIVLLNRLSNYSISNYVKDEQDYYSYLNLNISNLRSYGDACFLCKRVMDNQKLADYSATNAINQYWEEKKERYKLKTLPEIKDLNLRMKKEEKVKFDRLYRRMLATHYMNERMSELGVRKNDPYEVYKIIIEQIKKSNKSIRCETMTAYIYAVAYPFIVYRKSCREAVFHMVIIIFELFVFESTIDLLKDRVIKDSKEKSVSKEEIDELINMLDQSEGLYDIIGQIKDKGEFLKFLIKVSAELKCNYIIRPDKIDKILKKYYNLLEGKNKEEQFLQFITYYVSMVKKILSLSSDGSKGTYFEGVLHSKVDMLKLNDKKKKMGFEKNLLQAYIALYLENTGTLLDAVIDLQKNGIHLEEYYLENYAEILKMNGIKKEEDQKRVSQAFIEVYDHLMQGGASNDKNDHEVYFGYFENDFHRSIKYYNDLAERIKILTEAKRVQFLLDNDEWTLKINEEKNVVFNQKVTYEIFAYSEERERVYPILEEERFKNMLKASIMDTIAFEGKYAVIEYKKFYEVEEKKDFYFKPIYLILEYDAEIEWKQLEQIRRILVFRNIMIRQFEKDFGNNVMQNWIEQSRVIKQLEKARAFIHAKDSDYDDMQNVWNICKGFFLGRPIDKEEHNRKYENIKEGCILELMTDIRIGRINLLLLSNSEFRVDENPGKHKFRIAEEQIETLNKAYYWDHVCMLKENGEMLEGRVIEESIYDYELEENYNGKYNCVNEYLSYLISETIHSAATYGKKEDEKVKIKIYKENEYLFICNKMEDGQQQQNIIDGLERRGNGISLAVVCEYFIKQYKNRYVKLDLSDCTFRIGLPIFKKE